jgi:hypothetical protein
MHRSSRTMFRLRLSIALLAVGLSRSLAAEIAVDPVECCRAARSVLARVLGSTGAGAPLALRPGRRQLFLDDVVTESLEGLARRLHQPAKAGAVIRPDRTWEGKHLQIRTGPSWHPAERVWMLWYSGGAYATSRDGERWDKPILGVREHAGSTGNNLMLPATEYEFKDESGRELAGQKGDGTTIDNVFYDAREKDPTRRYKGMGYRGPICCLTAGRGMGFFPAVSPDGKRWQLLDTAFIPSGDEAHLFQDEETGLYVATVKQPGPYGRSVYLAVSTDFSHWTDPRDCLVFHADLRDQELGGNRVRMHLASPDLRKPVFHNPDQYVTDIYNLAVFPYEGIYIGMPTVFNHSGNTRFNSDGFSMVELATSRDLMRWERVGGREKFIPLSPVGDAATYDTAQLLAADRPIVTEREVWFYYSGLKWRDRPDGLAADAGGEGAICLAKLRRDGFVSLDAGERPGLVTTRPLVLAGASLHCNVDAPRGALRAAVLDGSGKPIPGFALDDAEVVTGDRLDATVRWRGASLASLTGKTVRLRFELRRGSFYAFWTQ